MMLKEINFYYMCNPCHYRMPAIHW